MPCAQYEGDRYQHQEKLFFQGMRIPTINSETFCSHLVHTFRGGESNWYLIQLSVQTHQNVYSSTNWPPFTEGQNSILNWVLKLNPISKKWKSNKNCLVCLKTDLFFLFFTFRSNQRCKVCTKRKITVQKTKRVCATDLFLPYFFWIKLRHRFSK